MAVKFERKLLALTVVGLVDAVSYMLVAPSLVFYVQQNGGTTDQYGLIMSAFSFSSFCNKPVLGWWSDRRGFRAPYVASLSVALLGGVLYTAASALPPGRLAVGAILAARLLGGCGGANSALGFAYVARSIPAGEQTRVNSLLSFCRILGMALGPAVNILVAKVDVPAWGLDSLNSVGLVIVACNMIAMASILYLLDEPVEEDSGVDENGSSNEEEGATVALTSKENGGDASTVTSAGKATKSYMFRSFLSMDVLVPMLSIFAFNANFQLIETGFAPAAHDALGWGPVESSATLGSISIIIAANMLVVMQLSKRGFSDSNILCGGLLLSAVGYTMLYFFWGQDATAWQFYLPVLLGTSSFPYLAATTRSLFTAAIQTKPALRQNHGSMQAVLSMAASVAGFVTPGVVAAYCLRSPGEIAAAGDARELTPFGLFAPVLDLLILIGMVHLRVSKAYGAPPVPPADTDGKAGERDPVASESTPMLPRPQRKRRRSTITEIMLEVNCDGLENFSRRNSNAETMPGGCVEGVGKLSPEVSGLLRDEP